VLIGLLSAVLLAPAAALVLPTPAGAAEQTETLPDGATITYDDEVVAGEPIKLSGTGWMTKEGHQGEGDYAIIEGDEGSITGIKFFGPDGTVVRDPKPTNPWNGDTDYASPDVWEIVQAAGTGEHWNGAEPGSWEAEIPWPSAENGAVAPPDLKPGDTFSLQFLSGTLYGNTVGNQELRPDVSRTINLTFTVVEDPSASVAPEVTEQPTNAEVKVGETATFTAAAKGQPEPTVQWQSSADGQTWTDVAGATGTTLTVGPVAAGDDGRRYRAVFTNEAGSDTTDPATLTVIDEAELQAPEVTKHPTDQAVDVGGDAAFTAEASGVPTPTVQWQSSTDGRTWSAIEGATKTTLTVADVAEEQDGAQYRAVFTNSEGDATSDAATLSINASAIEITEQPSSATVVAGGDAEFAAKATGVPTPTVQWQSSTNGRDWAPIAGATSTTLALKKVTKAQNQWQYRAVFTNSSGSATTEPAVLTVTTQDVIEKTCGESYGPGAAHTGLKFCFEGPTKVVKGEDIVIKGLGSPDSDWLATDGKTGSVVNFFVDAEFSGDPKTLYNKKTVPHPVTGKPVSDKRTFAMVQANSDGTWTARIPFPTSQNSETKPAQDISKLWAPGTKHSVRMLTGSSMDNDRQRGASQYLTVVESLDDEVGVSEPPYEHQTFKSNVAGDDAVAWVQQAVTTAEDKIRLSGTGWLKKDKKSPSALTVRLVNEKGEYYKRSTDQPGPDDRTVWQRPEISSDGEMETELPLPKGVKGGDYVGVELTTTADDGDVKRSWTSGPLMIDRQAYIPPSDGKCKAGPKGFSYKLAPGLDVPAAHLGGKIRMTGKNWCNLVGGGSLIAIKIDGGAYSHKGSSSAKVIDANTGKVSTCQANLCKNNKTIWYVIEAKKDGSFDVQIPVPGPNSTTPAFGTGSYRFQLLTRQISNDPFYKGQRPDPSRTMQTPEFTVVPPGTDLDKVKPGEPKAPAEPLHVTQDLTKSRMGGLKVDQQAKRWVVTIPGAKKDDWVFANVYDGPSPKFPWKKWYKVNGKRQISLPLAGTTLPEGRNKLSVQDRDSGLLGWNWVKVSSPRSGKGGGGVTGAGGPLAGLLSDPLKPMPTHTPEPPVDGYGDLNDGNAGGVTGVEKDGKAVITIPAAGPGDWVFLFLYTEDGEIIDVGWVQVGDDKTITVDTENLPPGRNKLAIVDESGELLGWTVLEGPDPTDSAIAQQADAAVADAVPTDSDDLMTYGLIAAAVLVLAGSAAAFIFLRTPLPTPTNP